MLGVIFLKYFLELMYTVNCQYLNHTMLCCTLAVALDPEVCDATLVSCVLTSQLHYIARQYAKSEMLILKSNFCGVR